MSKKSSRIRKLRKLGDQGFFGKILSVRAEFGYWVFTSHDSDQPAQRFSWNYCSEDGGGIMINIFCHWEYLINFLFGSINRGMTHATIELPERIDESGNPDKCTSDDAVFAIFVLERPINFHESWQRLANSVEYDNAFRFQWLERS